MELLDPSGKKVSSEMLKKQAEERTEQDQSKEVEQNEPEFAVLVKSHRKYMMKIADRIFKKIQLQNMSLNQQQAFQLMDYLHETTLNALFKKVYEMGIEDFEEVVGEEFEENIINSISMEKEVQTYSEEDLKKIEQANKMKTKN